MSYSSPNLEFALQLIFQPFLDDVQEPSFLAARISAFPSFFSRSRTLPLSLSILENLAKRELISSQQGLNPQPSNYNTNV